MRVGFSRWSGCRKTVHFSQGKSRARSNSWTFAITRKRRRSATLPELGRNLRRVRTAAGLSQTALAKRVGMERSYVGGMEAGQRNPTALTLKRLAKVLGVTPVAFFL
jgi:ribosome-binding protein aMBF1 (putative translation factor)